MDKPEQPFSKIGADDFERSPPIGGATPEREIELERLLSQREVNEVRHGMPLPLGATAIEDGINFALFSRHATAVRLDLFTEVDVGVPERSFTLDPARNKTGDIWHIWVQGIRRGQLYGFRVFGPFAPEQGHRFSPKMLLVDPYAAAITWSLGHEFPRPTDPERFGEELSAYIDNKATAPKAIVNCDRFDWQGDQPLKRPWSSTVIYELHVRGYTIHQSSGVTYPGTYHGLLEKIPHLKELGITAVELMPIQEFNELEPPRIHPDTGQRLTNYWGYDPLNFFAVKGSYASVVKDGAQVLEFREMVRAFHQAGIEVILDVVFNHTLEGNEHGPTVCFRGIDNAIYYWLAQDKRLYLDFTGTGQTVNAAHPMVRDHILDALRYWVIEMHVDGFRFDLASVLGRDRLGQVVSDAPLLERIAEDPILRDTKLIAEAWDAAGAYQVGAFSERRWSEWNGKFRDDVRRYWRGDEGMIGSFASRICGSSDLYAASGKGPEASINFVTCHDGFTLNDLVSYEHKHNQTNGENNRDGANENYSANYGSEGPTSDATLEALRTRQIKNFLLTLAIARGVPMLLAGDELCRTQRGNNNAYCQDNEISWVDWSLLDRHRQIHQFTRRILALRKNYPVFRRETFYRDEDITWFAADGGSPRWSNPHERCLACRIAADQGPDFYLMFNASDQPVIFVLPSSDTAWQLTADTAEAPPFDCTLPGEERPLAEAACYPVHARSSVILTSTGKSSAH